MAITIEKLTEAIKEITKQYNADIEWKESDALPTVMSISSKSAKYINYWMKFNTILVSEVIPRYDELYNLRYAYYKEESHIKYSTTEIKDMLTRDIELKEVRILKDTLLGFLTTLERYIKNIEGLRFDTKAVCDLIKLKNGII